MADDEINRVVRELYQTLEAESKVIIEQYPQLRTQDVRFLGERHKIGESVRQALRKARKEIALERKRDRQALSDRVKEEAEVQKRVLMRIYLQTGGKTTKFVDWGDIVKAERFTREEVDHACSCLAAAGLVRPISLGLESITQAGIELIREQVLAEDDEGNETEERRVHER